MAPFVPTNRAPGVYIEEIQEAGPIAGVGTSTAAFIGPAQQGPITTPTFLTNFTQFQNTFGGYITAPMVYVTHAVRGFFDNGGTTCYFVRVGTAARASRTLNDRAGAPRPTLVVTATREGVVGECHHGPGARRQHRCFCHRHAGPSHGVGSLKQPGHGDGRE